MARLTVRVDLGPAGAIGHGKVRLLEAVDALGSISKAAKSTGMSYRNAWLLIDSLNQAFPTDLVATSVGGARGGGAALTPFGREVIAAYRAIEAAANDAARDKLAALAARARATAPTGPAATKARRHVGRAARPAPPAGASGD